MIVAIGGNVAPNVCKNAKYVFWAISQLRKRLGMRLSVSFPYASPAWPPGSGGAFVNAVVVVGTSRPPAHALAVLHAIERCAGRVRRERWGPRVLDLDLVAVGRAVRPDASTARAWMTLDPAAQRRTAPATLVLPHPRLQDRAFVLRPMTEVAPGWRHPITGLAAGGMLARLPPPRRGGLRRVRCPWSPERRVRRTKGATLVKRGRGA